MLPILMLSERLFANRTGREKSRPFFCYARCPVIPAAARFKKQQNTDNDDPIPIVVNILPSMPDSPPVMLTLSDTAVIRMTDDGFPVPPKELRNGICLYGTIQTGIGFAALFTCNILL